MIVPQLLVAREATRGNTFSPASLLVFISFFVAAPALLAEYTLQLMDGRVIEDVQRYQLFENTLLYEVEGRERTVPSDRVRRLVDDSGAVVYEYLDLRVDERKRADGGVEFIFLRNGVEVGRGGWDAGGHLTTREGSRIPDGVYRQHYDNGRVHRVFPFRNGKLHGTSQVFFQNGVMEREGTFVNGREEGTSRLYSKEGILLGISEYEDGQKNGLTTLFYPTGEKKAEMTFVDNLAEGPQRVYYQTGQLRVEVSFKDGQKHGRIKEYYENGQLRFEGAFRQGKLHGESVSFYPSGNLKRRQTFVEGRVVDKAPAGTKNDQGLISKTEAEAEEPS